MFTHQVQGLIFDQSFLVFFDSKNCISYSGRMVNIHICLKDLVLLSAWLVIARGGEKISKNCIDHTVVTKLRISLGSVFKSSHALSSTPPFSKRHLQYSARPIFVLGDPFCVIVTLTAAIIASVVLDLPRFPFPRWRSWLQYHKVKHP